MLNPKFPNNNIVNAAVNIVPRVLLIKSETRQSTVYQLVYKYTLSGTFMVS